MAARRDEGHPSQPRTVLMTLDAVGGVWRYALDLARGLAPAGIRFVLLGLGPEPGPAQRAEAEALANARLLWSDLPLDWLAPNAPSLAPVPGEIARLARLHGADLLHLNAPSQAPGIRTELPVVCVSHSCLSTWWRALREGPLPADWTWRERLNAEGFARADAVLVPTAAHGRLVEMVYGSQPRLRLVPNGSDISPPPTPKERFVLAAGRWWDGAKGADVLDAAAGQTEVPVRMAGATRGPNGEAFVPAHAEALGTLGPGALHELMARAAIFASPARYEPFGLAVLEAANAGCALVLADTPGFRELWDGAALFVPPGDAAGFAQAFDGLASDPDVCGRRGARAAERAARYTLAAQAARLLDIYGEAMRTCTPALAAAGAG